VHALQEAPRAGWAALGAVLDREPRALARHYAKLRDAGLLRVMVTLGPRALELVQFGIVRLEAAPGRAEEVARRLAEWPQATTVRVTDGGMDVYGLVIAVNHRELMAGARRAIADIPDVARSEVHTVFSTVDAGRAGRLNSLSGVERRALQAMRPPSTGAAVRPTGDDVALLSRLGQDGRTEIAELARRTGREPSTLSRRLARLHGQGYLDFVAIVPDDVSSFPVYAMFWCGVDPADLPALERRLPALPWIETATVLSGRANLFLLTHVETTARVPALHTEIGGLAPSIRVHDVQIVSHAVKLHTRWLDGAGLWTDRVEDPYPALRDGLVRTG